MATIIYPPGKGSPARPSAGRIDEYARSPAGVAAAHPAVEPRGINVRATHGSTSMITHGDRILASALRSVRFATSCLPLSASRAR